VGDLLRMTDDELLSATRDDPEAFGVFYSRHVDFMIAFLRQSTGDMETALDLTAEVFAAALNGSRRYRPGEAPARAWLIGIARHKRADAHERGGRERSARQRLGMPHREFSDAEIERVELSADVADGYAAGLADLPPTQREAVTARVIEERDYAEIAADTGTSQATVRQRVSRGLTRLARNKEPRP
jgi:RNA polymerase sigma factor (sigma-70 family)